MTTLALPRPHIWVPRPELLLPDGVRHAYGKLTKSRHLLSRHLRHSSVVSAAAGGGTGTTGTYGVASAGGRTFGFGAAGGRHAAFQLTAPAGALKLTQFKFDITALPDDFNVTGQLYTNSSGSPGTQVGSDGDTILLTVATKTITFPTPPDFVDGTTYWIVFNNVTGGASDQCTMDTCADQASYGSGRNDTITSITNSLPSSEDWRVEATYTT